MLSAQSGMRNLGTALAWVHSGILVRREQEKRGLARFSVPGTNAFPSAAYRKSVPVPVSSGHFPAQSPPARIRECALLACALCLFAVGAGAAVAESRPAAVDDIRIEFDNSLSAGQQADLRNLLHNAHRVIAPLSFRAAATPPIHVEWVATGREFQGRLGLPPEHTMAAAAPSRRRVLINGEAFARADPAERQITMTHEYVHLFLGLFCPERLPLWLEEGLAMRLSGDMSEVSEWRLTLANTLGSLLPLIDLRSGFPGESSARSMAYSEGYSATGYFLSREYPITGARGLVEDLTDPKRGPKVAARLASADFSWLLEAGWRGSLRSFWAWIDVATSASVLWGVITVLFLAAYLKRRHDKRRQSEADEWDDAPPSKRSSRFGRW